MTGRPVLPSAPRRCSHHRAPSWIAAYPFKRIRAGREPVAPLRLPSSCEDPALVCGKGFCRSGSLTSNMMHSSETNTWYWKPWLRKRFNITPCTNILYKADVCRSTCPLLSIYLMLNVDLPQKLVLPKSFIADGSLPNISLSLIVSPHDACSSNITSYLLSHTYTTSEHVLLKTQSHLVYSYQ